MSKEYYEQRKLELQKEDLDNVVESYFDIERIVNKRAVKYQEIQRKLAELENPPPPRKAT